MFLKLVTFFSSSILRLQIPHNGAKKKVEASLQIIVKAERAFTIVLKGAPRLKAQPLPSYSVSPSKTCAFLERRALQTMVSF